MTHGHSWSIKEFDERRAALAAAPRRLVSVIQGELPEEFQIIDHDGQTSQMEISWQVCATNAILSALNFDQHLRGYLDALIGLARRAHASEFRATNKELAKELRSGRLSSSDESIARNLARIKRKFCEWQAYKNFQLVAITPGKYNVEKQRNEITLYQVHLIEYIEKTLALAKSHRRWNTPLDPERKRRLEGIIIHSCARRVLHRLPNCPPLDLQKKKTLSKHERVTRRHRSVITFVEKNRDDFAEEGISYDEYFDFLHIEIEKVRRNKPGVVGQLLTEAKDEPHRDILIYERVKNGTILEEVEPAEREDKTVLPRIWDNGRWVESSNKIETKDQVTNVSGGGGDISVITPDVSTPKSPNLQAQGGGDISVTTSNVTTPASVNFERFEEVDLTNFIVEAEGVKEMGIDEMEMQEIFTKYCKKVRKAVPDKPAGWHIHWYDQFDSKTKEAEAAMFNVMGQVCDGQKTLADFNEAFADWIMTRTSYFENGAPLRQSESRLTVFRQKMSDFLKLPEDVPDD